MDPLEGIRKALLDLPYAKEVGQEYVYIRCPLCGDSKKHMDGAHCSIWIRPGIPLIYHCWICESSGIVKHDFLKDAGLYDSDLYGTVYRVNKEGLKGRKANNIFISPKNLENIKVPEIRQKAEYKIQYMIKRLGVNFTRKSLEYLRVITSLYDFLELNNLKPNRKYEKNLLRLDRDYIGFLSTDKSCITFRAVSKDPLTRYIKYQLFEQLVNDGSAGYTIPMRVNPMVNDIELNLTEGVFDILGVFFHVYKAKTENVMYAAACGSGYLRIVNHFLRRGFIGNLTVNIYSDSDKYKDWYKPIIEKSPWLRKVNLYYNERSKDFGVPEDLISVKKAVL